MVQVGSVLVLKLEPNAPSWQARQSLTSLSGNRPPPSSRSFLPSLGVRVLTHPHNFTKDESCVSRTPLKPSTSWCVQCRFHVAKPWGVTDTSVRIRASLQVMENTSRMGTRSQQPAAISVAFPALQTNQMYHTMTTEQQQLGEVQSSNTKVHAQLCAG